MYKLEAEEEFWSGGRC